MAASPPSSGGTAASVRDYYATQNSGVFYASSNGSGSRPAFGQAVIGVPPGVSYTHGTGVRVRVRAASASTTAPPSDDADPSQQQRQQQQHVLQEDVTGSAVDETIAAEIQAVLMEGAASSSHARGRKGAAGGMSGLGITGGGGGAYGESGAGTDDASLKRIAAEIAAVASAATSTANAASLKVQYEPHALMTAWKNWLLRMLLKAGYRFPGSDQSPLCSTGIIDMAMAERQQRGEGEDLPPSKDASALDEAIPPYDASNPAAYVAMVSEADADEGWLWPAQVPEHIVCWHDGHTFEGPHVSIPARRVNDTWVMRGIYCSVPCAISAIITSALGEHERHTRLFNLGRWVAEVTLGNVLVMQRLFRPALELPDLWCRGGSYTIEQWRLLSHCSRLKIRSIVPPYVPDDLLREIQSREHGLLMDLRTSHTIVTEEDVIEVPESHIPPAEVFQRMAQISSAEYSSAIYAQYCRTQDELDKGSGKKSKSSADADDKKSPSSPPSVDVDTAGNGKKTSLGKRMRRE